MSISGISARITENLHGCISLRLASVSDIQSFPRNIKGKLIGNIFFKENKNWVLWHPIESTLVFQSDSQDSPEGVFRRNIIPFTLVAKDVDEYILQILQFDEVIALVTDRNYNNFVIGNPQTPLRFTYSRNSGTTNSGRNELSCSLIGTRFHGRALYNQIINFNSLIDHNQNDIIDQQGNVIIY
jgi:hypothetical protein